MASLVDCYQFLLPPRVKARLKEYLVHLKLYEARYRELKANIPNLKKARDSVQRKVDEEDNRYGNGIPREVADWIKAVDTIISECDEFDEDEDHQLAVFDLFKSGYLPKTGIRYRLSTKAFAITRKVNGLLQTAKHDTYSYWLGPPSIASFFHTVGYESFPSREESMKKIKEALKSPNVRVIGLHGLSGVGKTTLVKKIARDALQASEAAKMFDVVAMSSLTRNPDIRQIQGHIADALGMKLDEESDIARAARIRRRLKNESTLIILDDLWAALDLNMLGIPLDVDNGDGQNIWTETAKEISSGNVKEGKIPGLLRQTKTMKEIPFGNLNEGKNPREHHKTKTMKEIPHGNVNEGKSSVEHSKTKSEGNNSVVNMMKSRTLPSASNMKTEETLSHYKGCKVLLISESKQVLLSQMEGKEDSIYFIKVLKEKEAEAFFMKMAGMGNGKTEFDKLTMSIVHKCNGLPMSIVTTARALKNQSFSVWEDVHRHLERGNLTGVSDFSTKLSYDLLEDEELKYAFLLCARMGPDALLVDLVKYCIGLGFLQEIYTVKEARDRVSALVGKLKVFGLLSDSYSSDHFSMQDIVRSAALSIASKEKHAFTKTKGKIDEWPDKLERYAAISLHHCHIIDGFPRRINYPRLRFFQVNNNDPHLKIPKNFFKGMKELRVLLLTGIHISPLDSSIASLTELKMLSLEQCVLDKELSVIGELKKLRILSFSGSDIEKFPVELKQLKKLQIFDISNCSKLTYIPSNVLSSLISLEELYMRNTLIQWEVEEHNYQSENASLSELRHLKQLTTLDIHIPNAAHLPKNLFFHKLYSYKIVVGDLNAYSDMDVKMPEKYEASRFLAIQLKKGFDIHSQKGIKMLFERVENLFLEELNGVQDIFFRLNLKGFPYLKHLLIVNNSDIQSLINPKDRQHAEKAFPKLESLHLYNLKSMGEICSCKLSAPSFRKLKVIKINLCGKLTNLILFSVISLLTVLETIEVSECNALKEIVPLEVLSNNNEIMLLKFPELRSLTLLSLPELIGFYPIPSTGGKATELFHEKVELPKLERMVLSSIQIYKVWSDESLQISCFKNLIHMDVNGCWNLEYLISFSMATSLVNLQSLFVSDCEKMSYIFSQGQGSRPKMKGSIFSNLKNIKLSSMKSLLEIWNSELPSNSFEKLDTLIIEECDKLVNVFPCYVEGMFKSLCNLRVTNCKSMKTIFELDHKKQNDVDVTNMQDVHLETLPKLEHVWKWSKDRIGILELKSLQKMCVHDCYLLENIFPVSIARLFPSLECLVIRDCFELREIVPKRHGTNSDTRYIGPSFEFPNLTTIKFSELPKLSGFYPGAYKLSCPALNDLSIELCDRLEPFKKETTEAQTRSTLFSEEVINKLKCMQIESWHAKSSNSYMGEGNHRQDNLEELCLSRLMNPGILYSFLHRNPNLKSLSLKKCFVTEIVPLKMPPETENLGVVPKLERLMLIDMPDLETIGFEGGIILEWIELLILKQCPLLVNIMPSSVSLTHLTNLEVVNCGGLKILMPLSAAKSLVQLNSMKVIGCESMEEVVENENENGGKVDEIVENENAVIVDIVFRKLRVLELLSLKKLNSFSKSCVTEFPSLEKLVVSACPKMESFSEKVQSSPLLEKIFVHENEKIWCWNDDLNSTIQEIFKEKKFFEGMDEISLSEHHDLQKLWNCGAGDLEKSWFYNLKILRLEDCENLSCAIPSNMFVCLKSLKELEVRNCNKVGLIFGNLENDDKAIRSQLKNLTLEGLSELKHVWGENYQGTLIFQNLLHVSVIDCEGLKTLFPAVVAKNIKKLKTLKIASCKNLLEIVEKEVYTGVAPDDAEKFVFPCLTSLYLYSLPELTYFYCEIFTVECPELHKLLVLNCPRFELFRSARLESESEGNITSTNRQPLFSNLQAISFLEILSVDCNLSSVLGSSLQLTEDLNFLKEIRMFFDADDIEKPTLPFDILDKAPNLRYMTIEFCNSLEIFHTPNLKISKQLKTFVLSQVPELKFIWSEDSSWLNIVCEKIYNLDIICCPGLTRLFSSPSAVSFCYLEELSINQCHGLEYLFTSSVAKVLMHLEKITVKESQSIKEIVEMEEEDGRISLGVKFERLYSIILDSLSSLEYFYSGNDTLQLPSLTLVNIQKCPKMDVFSRGGINAESFRGIHNSAEQNDELIFYHDLNVSVKMVFLLQMLSEGMDATKFLKHPELHEAWQDGLCTQNSWFYSLRTLKLVNCDIKPYAIPSNILPCLNSLKDLEVRNCNTVEVIFAKNDTDEIPTQLNNLILEDLSELKLVWEKNFQGILQFQNLKQVSVIGCKSIQTLFPAVLAENLKMLDKLEVKSCDELREIVGKEDVATGLEKKFSFPHLSSLELYNLPKITYFYPEVFTVGCPKLFSFTVMDCPMLELFQGSHAEGETESISTSTNRQPLIQNLDAIPMLEELYLGWKHIPVLRLGQQSEVLKYLKKAFLYFNDVSKNETPTFPLEIFEKVPNLEYLQLGWIYSVEIFLTKNANGKEHEMFGQLQNLKLQTVYKLQYIDLEDSWLNTAVENLHKLEVSTCPDLEKLFHYPCAVSFSYMKELYVSKCHGLRYLFTCSMAKVLTALEKITVEESQSITEIVAKEQDGTTSQGIKFERLCYISLNSLSSLECFYSDNGSLQLPSLTQMSIWKCPKLKVFSSGEINAKSFRGVQASSDSNDPLVLYNDLNASVKRVFLLQMLSDGMHGTEFSKHPELHEAWQDGLCTQNSLFYSLRTLKLVNCDIKPYAIPSNILPCLNSLKDLEVRNCNKVEAIFTKNDTDEVPSQLNNLTLEDLSELKLVWEKNFQGILQFQNLKQVSVIGCKSIQTLFPAVLAENLKMLDKLEVKSCDELREIVGEEDVATGLEKTFTFPHLTSLDLNALPELTYFYPEIFTVVCPKLSFFSVLDCPKLELFQGAHAEREAESISPSTNRQPLIPNLDTIPMLEVLYLDWKHISVLRLGQQAEDLKFLKKTDLYFDVEKNEKPTLPLEILEKVPNLQHLVLGCINSLEIFLTKNTNGREHGILGQLKILTLDRVSELQYINLEDSWLNTVIEKLHDLFVISCPDLINLFHSPCVVSFSCMKELYVSKCHGLRYLFTCSMAKVLTTLEKITVNESQSITEIVAKEQDGTTSQGVKFERLCYIYLNSLSSLECFYSDNGSLQLPSLTQVSIWQCPKLKVFSSGEINAKSFRGIQASSDSNDPLVLHNDLNASVKRVFLLQMLSKGMDRTEFSKHPELREAWQDGLCTQNSWFYSLRTLKLVNCDIKPYAIPSNILPCLNSLKDLEVRSCNTVEVIFAKNDTDEIPTQLNNLILEDLSELKLVWEKNFQGILQFKNLKQVSVIGCKSIQTLFPAVLAENLKMLDKLIVKSCRELQEIVGKEDVATGVEKKFSFPHLSSLELNNLPKITYFYPEVFTVGCPKLFSFTVMDCPMLELFKGSHAEGEAESIITSTSRQPLIPNLDVIPMLEELYLGWKHISVLRLGQQSEVLKYLKKAFLYFNDVSKNETPTFPLEIFEKVPNLQDLQLGWIYIVDIFLTKTANGKEHGMFRQLKNLKLQTVYKLQYINLEDSWLNTAIENLHKLEVSTCPDLEKLFHSPCAVSFSYMKELYVSKCHGLRYLFTCSMAKVLTTLEKITLEESQSITEIVAKVEDGTTSQGVKFERLCYIYLKSLSSLECFYSGNGSLQLPSLTQVSIWQCPKLKVFSSGEINAKSFKGVQASSDLNDPLVLHNDLNASVKRVFLLQMLSKGMDRTEFSKHPELREAWQDGLCTQNSWFYSLRTLKLVNCDIKPYVIPSNILPCLNSLKDLEVRSCNTVEVIFAKNDTDEIPTQLNNLILEDLSELKLVWEKNFQGILQFKNLKQVSVIGCKSIQTLFPAVLAENLKMLDKLIVKSCRELQEIVGKEDVATGLEKKFSFPHLSSLELYNLPKITYFYPEVFTVGCPKLFSFTVMGCPMLELFKGSHAEGEAESIITSTSRQPLIPNLDVIPMLEELYLDWKHIQVLMLGQQSEVLKYLKKAFLYFNDVSKNETPTFPLEIFEKVPNLQDLQLGWIYIVDIFLTKTANGKEHWMFGQLKNLKLRTVYKLQYINLEDSWLNTAIENLHKLEVSTCPDLEKLFHSPCAVSFSYMKELYVKKCHGLRYLFTCSMAKVLTTLEKITIEESQSITEIVAKEEDGTTSQGVKFERLCYIYLKSLSSLECFYSDNGSLQLPSLTQVSIWQCPKLKVFSSGEINAKSFKGVQASSNSNDPLVLHNDLNASVKRVFLLQMLSKGLDGTEFSKHPELHEAWQDGLPTQNSWFYSLTTLKLVNCDIQPYAIPSNILPCLNSLKDLEVQNCNKVEVIFAKNDTDEIPSQLNNLTLKDLSELKFVWEKNFQGILQFQNLKQVSVIGCKNIQTLFPAVLAENLKMLDKLEVKSCDELREIVGKEDVATGLEKKFSFPHLTSLDLYVLPELTYFYPEIFTVVCPKLSSFSVLDCPKLELFQGARAEDEAESISTSTYRQPLIPNLDTIPMLEELYLDWKHISVLRLGQQSEDLKYLKKSLLYFDGVEENEKPPLPLEIFEKVPNLQDLQLGWINSLEMFLIKNTNSRAHKILGQLKILTLDTVSELQYINLEDSWLNTVIEKLHNLKVSNCPDLKNLIHSPCAVSFSCMKELHISGCHGLRYLFTCSMAKVLTTLEKITVEESRSITEIVAKEQDQTTSQGVKFERLCYLYLNSLSSLECFYSGNGSLQLPSLTQVNIWQCPKVKGFSSGEIKVNLLQGIKASSDLNNGFVLYKNDLNASVEKLFLLRQEHLVFVPKSDTVPNWCSSNLTSLIVQGCEFLGDAALPSHLLPSLSNLKTLEVRNCNSIKAIFVYTKVGPQGCLGLPLLEKLHVVNCKKLQEIVAKEEKATEDAKKVITIFPRITCLFLMNLFNMRCIYPGVHILEWPILKELVVTHCPILKFFTIEFQSSRDLHSENQDSFPTIQQAFVSLEKVTPSLKVLTLGKEEAKMMEQGKLHVDLQELNTLRLQCFHDKTDVFPFVFHSKAPLPGINYLLVRHSAFKEIFPSQTPDIDYNKLLSELKKLDLNELPQLESIGFEHSWIGPFIENLQIINVLSCASLTNLTPSTVSFSKLEKLNVKNCSRLKSLFTSSTAKTLSVLKEMILVNCESLIEIVAKEGDEPNEGEMLFMELSILTLGSLPKLGSFYSGSFTLSFSSLKEVSFTQCNNTKVFCLGDKVPDQLKVTIDGVVWGSDKNEVIMQQIDEEA